MKKLLAFICFVFACSMLLCGCSDNDVQSVISEGNISKSENSLISDSDPSYLISLPERAAFDFIDGREFTFLPIISEEEMDYMGIPYKDLTPEQVIQMWAQCTRERNWQKMYHIEKYENYSSQDSYRFEQSISDMFGRLLQCYYDVEVSEKASRENGEVLYYSIEARVVYYDSEKENDILVEDPSLSQCVVMKKIDGYWRIIDMGTGIVIPDEVTQDYDFSQYELIKENGTTSVIVTEMIEDGFKGQSYWDNDKDIEYTILCNKENKKVINVGDHITLCYKKIYKTGENTAIIVLDNDFFKVMLPPDSR